MPDYAATKKATAIHVATQGMPPQPLPKRRNFRDITGRRFYHLVAKEYVGVRGRISAWKCRCDCGNYLVATSNRLLGDGIRQCGSCARAIVVVSVKQRHAKAQINRLPNLHKGSTSKPCCECKQVKLLTEFTCRRKEPDGLARQCRDCLKKRRDAWIDKNPNRPDNGASQRYKERYPERRIESIMKCKYGIGFKEYNSLMESQGEKCAICGAPPVIRPHSTRKTLCIDHDHETGTVRGLLCRQCNHGIGLFADNPEILERAASYLRNTEKES